MTAGAMVDGVVGSGLGAAIAAAVAADLWLGHRSRLAVRRPAAHGGVLVAAGLAGGGALAVVLLHGTHVALALVGLTVLAAGVREARRRRQVAAAETRAELVLAACEGLASDLRAGQPPVSALIAAAEEWPELGPVAAAARLGADVPAAFRSLASRPGATQLRVVGAAWQVAHRSGAGLAAALAMAADQVRGDRATARVVTTELASAQATARLLVALPVAVLLLGNGLGGDPVGFLLGTPAGLVCLTTGLALEYAGLAWLARIADQVSGRRPR